MLLLACENAHDWTQVSESVALLQADNSFKSLNQLRQIIRTVETTADAGDVATGLLAMAKSHDGKWSKKESDDLTPLIRSLVGSYDSKLQQEHEADQTRWDTAAASQAQCHSTASDKVRPGGDVYAENEELNKRKAKLKACHAVDKAWNDYKLERECQVPATVKFGEISVSDSQLTAALASKVSTYQSTLPVNTGLPASDCSSDQGVFEEQQCLVRRLHLWNCEAQVECTMTVDLANLQQSLIDSQANRQKSQLSFKKLICQVYAIVGFAANGAWNIGGSAAALAACDSTVLDPGELVLNLEMPKASHCNGEQDLSVYPSQTNDVLCSEWKTKEYENWGTEYTAPTNCQATCEDVPTTAAPTEAPTAAPTAAPGAPTAET